MIRRGGEERDDGKGGNWAKDEIGGQGRYGAIRGSGDDGVTGVSSAGRAR